MSKQKGISINSKLYVQLIFEEATQVIFCMANSPITTKSS